MINWGNKKYGPQAKGIQIGPRVKAPAPAKQVMSKAGTPLKPYTPPKKYQAGGRPLPTTPKKVTPTARKVNPKMR